MQNQDPTEIQLEPSKPDNHIDFFAPKILWTIIGFLLLVVIVGGMLWWKEVKSESLLERKIACAQDATLPVPCGSLNPKSDWKTYSNTEYGFEFKYPSHWTHRSGSEKIFILDLLFESQKDEIEIQFILNNGEFTPCEENCVRNRTENISGNNWSIYDLAYDKKHGKAGVLKKDNLRFAFTSFEKVNFDSRSFDLILSTFKFFEIEEAGARVPCSSGQLCE